MKRVLFLTVLVLQFVVLWDPAQAQQREEPKYLRLPHRFQIFLEGGIALPTKPSLMKDMWNSGFDFGIGAGMSIFPWLEVNGGFNTMSFSLDALKAKSALNYQGIADVEGGTITTRLFYGSARFLAVPKARTNPYAEVAVGYFRTAAEDVFVQDGRPPGDLINSMPDVSGMMVAPSVGLQYALSDYWSAYARYTYVATLNDQFSPGDLLQPVSGSREDPTGSLVIQAITVGIMVRF